MTSTPATASSRLLWARAGAICYIVWGFIHLQAAYAVYHLGTTLQPNMTQGRIYQDAWNLLFFGLAGIILGVTLNWRNSRWGYWINLGVIALTDTGFIFFVLVPGYYPFWPGIDGPVFWFLGWIFLSIALPDARN